MLCRFMGSEGTGKRIVAIFLKFPDPGKVKTRLGATMGHEAAAKAYRKLVGRVFEQVSRNALADELAICYDPPEKEVAIRQWLAPWADAFPGEVTWIPQCPGDLGSRLIEANEKIFSESPKANLVVIGTDCIHLDSDIFAETWTCLDSGEADIAISPSEDGGYVLVGMNRFRPVVFQNIPWSVSETFSETVKAAEGAGLTVHSLPVRCDIDSEPELLRFQSQLADRPCVFFDRDGVVNRSPGTGYVLGWEDFHLNDGIVECLRIVHQKGYLAVLITSQKGVGKGLMSSEELHRIHHHLQVKLLRQGAAFDGIYAFTGEIDCPHQPKPDPEMIFSAAKDFGIDLEQSWMIGDADRDIEMGQAAGLFQTVRIQGEKTIGIEAPHTLSSILKIPELFRKSL